MRFEIRFGKPNMSRVWNELIEKVTYNTANKDEIRLYKKLIKTLKLLSENPKHNGLHSHSVEILSQKLGIKVWESYLENHKPASGRIFWIYHPPGSITVIGLSPHPNDNKHSYETITLSSTDVK